MKRARTFWSPIVLMVTMLLVVCGCGGMDIVRDGVAVATIVVTPSVEPETVAGRRRGRGSQWDDAVAGKVLADWIEKITGAKVPIAESVEQGAPAIYVGAAAVKEGLELGHIKSDSREGVRVFCDGKRVLIAGQSEIATAKGVCRFLEQLGCRYFMDHPLGEVYPKKDTLTVGILNITEKPGLLSRKIGGSRWGGMGLWKVWNGAGGLTMRTGHAWNKYVRSDVFEEHPEYFALKKVGEVYRRRNMQWLCTSDDEMRKLFAKNLIATIESGDAYPSISPPDGRSYCDCEKCSAQDDPNVIEPNSQLVSKTNRFVDFFDYLGREVAKEHPDSILNFYCYADYTQPPTLKRELSKNLCGWIAPIRYCWLHGIGNPRCKSRQQLREVIDGWARVLDKIAYRTYNYNYADCTLPFSKVSIWKHDIPYLKSKGCIGINFETLPCWMIYTPHLYLGLRLSYDPRANADAMMNDFFTKFYGPAATSMKRYWTDVDEAFQDLQCDPEGKSRGLGLLHLVYTPEFLDHLQQLIDKATEATRTDETYLARVEMTAEGLKNAFQYIEIYNATEAQDFQKAKRIFDKLVARNREIQDSGLTSHYTVKYLQRFLGKEVALRAATGAPNKVVTELADVWVYKWDEENAGIEQGYWKDDFDDSTWTSIPTYSESMTGSGRLKYVPRKTYIWHRVHFEGPKPEGKLVLLFVELAKTSTVYLNGKAISTPKMRRDLLHDRQTFEADVTDAIREGENVIAIHRVHIWGRLTSNPVMLIRKGE